MVTSRRLFGYAMVLGATVCLTSISDGGDPAPPKMPPPVLPLGPYVRYTAPHAATIGWETAKAGPSAVVVGGKGLAGKRFEDSKPKTRHEITVTGLSPGSKYTYQIVAPVTGRKLTLDTQFNYTLIPLDEKRSPYKGGPQAKAAADILQQAGIDRGYCLVYGCGKGQLAYELARRSGLTVVGVDEDASAASQARKLLAEAGAYGSRVTVHQVKSLAQTPLTRFFANLIVSDAAVSQGKCPGAAAEMYRMLAPGGVAVLPANDAVSAWLKAGNVKAETVGQWRVVRRGPLPGSGTWTHQYGTAGNAAFAGETLGGASATSDVEIQWLGRPGADFGLDRQVRMPAPLFADGRLYHQGMQKIIALDGYNGAVLWLMEIADLLRVNIPRDASNWCADEARLFVAVRGRCWALDGPTGKLLATYAVPDTGHDWGYVANEGNLLFGSCVKSGSTYSDYWTGKSWYDSFTGPGTFKVCSDKVFACDKTTGKRLWTYEKGAIINSTMTVGKGRMYFVECRHPKMVSAKTGRIGDAELWQNLFLVALDAKTGKKVFEKPLTDTAPGHTVYYLAYSDERLFLVASSGKEAVRGGKKTVSGTYNIYTFAAADGAPGWKAEHPWVKGDHSGHMQHPVITPMAVYLEPRGYDVKTGKVISTRVGPREGCATFAGTTAALLHRGPGRRSAIWSQAGQQSTQWPSLRTSCWLSMIPAGGMILSPEGGGGCSCGTWIETSVGFLPKVKGGEK